MRVPARVTAVLAVSTGVAVCGSSVSLASASSAASNGVAAAKAIVAQYSKAPTSIGSLKALPTKAPKGKTIVFLQCEEQQCAEVDTGFADATKAIGWKLKTIGFNLANPATLTSALKTALQYHPAAVEFQGAAYQTWASEIPAYKAAHVALVPITAGVVPTSKTVPIEIGSPAEFRLYGKLVADWFIADSHGKGKAVFANVPEFPTFAIMAKALTKEVAAKCPHCTVTASNVTVAELDANQMVPTLVSALRSDPSATYALASDGALVAGLPAALKAAGVSNVKVAGATATEENQQDLIDGTESAWTVQSFQEEGWIGTDVALRKVEGTPIPASEGIEPTLFLTKKNVGKPVTDYPVPANYRTVFKHLWAK